MVLGDHFPKDSRDEFVAERLQVGSVLYLHCAFTTPPKPKYLLVACLEPEPLVFVINSKINNYVARRPHLASCQVSIDLARHSFLEHDSYVDCTECTLLYPTTDELKSELAKDIDAFRGRVQAEVLEQVLAATKKAKTIVKKRQRMIIAAIENR